MESQTLDSTEKVLPAIKVSVVIPAYNAASSIEATLNALQGQITPPETFEVLVVDDGSSDATPAKLTAWMEMGLRLRVLSQSHAGPAAARNLGVVQAQGEIVLFTDADCAPAADWIEKMCAPFQDQAIAGVKGTYRTRQKQLVARFVQIEYEDKYARMRREKYIDFIDTYSAGYRREVFLANGGFDLAFSSASVEDQEFSFRLASQGLKMVFVPDAYVYHSGHAATLAAYLRKKFKIGYWKVLVHRRHPDKMLRDSHTPQVLKAQILLAGLSGLFLLPGLFAPFWRWASGATAGVLFLTTLPFAARAWPKDRAVALAAPFLLLARALALGAGFAAGLLHALLRTHLRTHLRTPQRPAP